MKAGYNFERECRPNLTGICGKDGQDQGGRNLVPCPRMTEAGLRNGEMSVMVIISRRDQDVLGDRWRPPSFSC
ncbi:hypothetical protein R1flu_022755 [Riccia fluitans]|uniref:Uncharacterized protein n=1 Tax=Riccia fluitans TaxID=41844 RepID=A0ABD1XQ29_9MARC